MPGSWRALEGDCSVPEYDPADAGAAWSLMQNHFSCLDTRSWLRVLPGLLPGAGAECSMNARAVENECWASHLSSPAQEDAYCVARMRTRQLDIGRALSALFLTVPVDEVGPQTLAGLLADAGVCVSGTPLLGTTATPEATIELVETPLADLNGRHASALLRVQGGDGETAVVFPAPTQRPGAPFNRVSLVHAWTGKSGTTLPETNQTPQSIMWATILDQSGQDSVQQLSMTSGAGSSWYVESILYYSRD
jgi:hypothetical protein